LKKLQEQVNEKAVALCIKGGKITGRLLAKAMQAFLTDETLSERAEHTPKHSLPGKLEATQKGVAESNVERVTGDKVKKRDERF
jgi:hypothetical protein